MAKPVYHAEEWRVIPGSENYEVSSLGRVRSIRSGKLLSPWLAGIGYHYIEVGRARRTTVHRLVCETFHGPPPDGQGHVAHFDGNKLNNRPENLRWASRKENFADSVRHGTAKLVQYRGPEFKPRKNPNPRRGTDSSSAKLSEAKAADIRARHQQGEHWSAIAKSYGVSKTTFYRVLRGEVWD